VYTAIVWIGKYGSWSKGGFTNRTDAQIAAMEQIASGAYGDRTDLRPDVEGPEHAAVA